MIVHYNHALAHMFISYMNGFSEIIFYEIEHNHYSSKETKFIILVYSVSDHMIV